MRIAASGPAQQRRSQRHDVGAVVLARVARDRLVGAHRGADAAHLVGGDRRADAGAVDHDAGVRLAARDRSRHRGRRCPGSPPARLLSRAEVGRPRARGRAGAATIAFLQRHAGVIAADRHAADVRHRRQIRRQRRVDARRRRRPSRAAPRSVSRASGVTWPPAASSTVAPRLEHPRVGLGDESNRFMSLAPPCTAIAMYGRLRYFSA